MYERVIFDIDGTMIDSEKAVRLSLRDLIKEEWGVEKKPEDLVFSFGIPGVRSLKELGFSDPEAADRRWGELLLKYFSELIVFPGVEKLLQGLKERGIKLGILTSKTRAEYEEEFVPFGLSSYFEDYICADDTMRHKPDPEPMNVYLSRCGGKPERTLYVGDTVYDEKCARLSGVNFALACWGTHDRRRIKACLYPESPAVLLKMLNGAG